MAARRRMLARPSWYGMAAVLVLGASLLSGCGQDAPKDVSGQAPTEAAPAQTLESGQGQLGADLIAHPASPFAVTFKWENPARGEQGLLLWRQGNGVRRWDLVRTKDGEITGGSITFATAFSSIGALGSHSLGCLWVTGESAAATRDAPPGRAFVSCSWGGSLTFKPIHDTLLSRLGPVLQDKTIAERSASCYSLDNWRLVAGTLCVDASDGIPLLIITDYGPTYAEQMEAVAISTAQQDVPVPLGLERAAGGGFPDYEGMAALSDLGLPDLPDVEDWPAEAKEQDGEPPEFTSGTASATLNVAGHTVTFDGGDCVVADNEWLTVSIYQVVADKFFILDAGKSPALEHARSAQGGGEFVEGDFLASWASEGSYGSLREGTLTLASDLTSGEFKGIDDAGEEVTGSFACD